MFTVKSAFSDVGSGSFWSEQRTTNGQHSIGSTLQGMDSDSILGVGARSFGGELLLMFDNVLGRKAILLSDHRGA